MGQAVSGFAHDAGLAQQKSDLEKQQIAFANQLQEGTQTRLAHVQGAESRDTAVVTAGAQGDASIRTQKAANELPLSEPQKSEDKYRTGSLAETVRHNEAEEGKPIPGSYSGAFMVKDPTAPNGYHLITSEAKTFTPEMGALMGALAERGVSLPAGMRSQAQQVSLYKSLIERNPGKTSDEIADGIKGGQIQFGAEKKETQVAAGISGKVAIAENEIKAMAPLIREAAAKVDTNHWLSVNKLIQMKDNEIQDPNLRVLKQRITTLMNAYDVLAGRGGTDRDKRAEAHAMITSADSPDVLNAGLDNFVLEADVAKKAAREAMRLHPENDDAPAPKADTTAKAVTIPPWVKPGDKYSPSLNKARKSDGTEYGPEQ